MTSQEPNTTSSEHEAETCQRLAKPAPQSASGPSGTVDRQTWAQLIADGEIPFPAGLGNDEEARLACDVAQRRRIRLINYIARIIALDIHRSSAPDDTEKSS